MASVASWTAFEQLCAEFLWIRCAAIKDPTSLTAPFPYGGTVLGMTSANEFTLDAIDGLITASEFGGIPVDAVTHGVTARLVLMLRTPDADALATILPGVTVSTLTGKARVRPTIGTMRGQLATSTAFKLLLVPRDAEGEPALYFPLTYVRVDKTMRAARDIDTQWGLPILAQALPDASGRPFTEERLEDVVL